MPEERRGALKSPITLMSESVERFLVDPGMTVDQKMSGLRTFRSSLNSLLGTIDTYLGDLELQRQTQQTNDEEDGEAEAERAEERVGLTASISNCRPGGVPGSSDKITGTPPVRTSATYQRRRRRS